MPLTIGTQLGSHEITGLLGKGGMGEVYRGRDTKLKREVAIKILPEEFSRDPARVSRFQREAEVLASLNHPNIAAIYDLQEVNDTRFLVLELVEGETLAERIQRGSIAVEEALDIARLICEALEAAHEKGIVHRDLKPANIKVTPDSKVKVLDFGLAKALDSVPSTPNLSNSPTLSLAATNVGLILGTAAYMSPEQAKGQAVDRRTDIFAFGCVLYEMLSGRAAFEGEDVQDVLGAVLKSEPDWTRLPTDVPTLIRRLLRFCLQKDSKKRRQTAGDVRIDIEEALAESLHAVPDAPRLSRRNERRAWLAALVVITIAAAAVSLGRWGTAPPTPVIPETRLQINTPPTTDPTSLAISPDGQTLAFVGLSNGQSYLWLRPFNSVSARLLPETDGASFPFWSPDSRSVAFFAYGQLRQVSIDGGSPRTLANASSGVGGTWNNEGVILFSTLGSPILRIPDRGGDPTPATRLDALQGAHYFPQFLPDGRHFLYWAASGREPNGVYIGQIDGPETRRLLDAEFGAVYAQDHLLFVRRGVLFAQRFDRTRLVLDGTPFQVAEQVTSSTSGVRAAVSTSAAGPIAYRTGSAVGGERRLTWFDRSGRQLANVGGPFSSTQLNPSLSPDGRRVALFRAVMGNIDVWLLDVERDVPSRFTVDSADDVRPLWSGEGNSIVFSSNRKGFHDLYQKSSSDAASEEALLLQTAQNKFATDWSADGRFLLYDSIDPKQNVDIWALQLDGEKKAFPVVQTDFEEHGGQFSPDGKWIAYVSIKSGRYEVYVRRFPQGTGGEIRISSDGGDQVRWPANGKELFYIARDGQLLAVPIRVGSNSEAVEPGSPVRLFGTRIGDWGTGARGTQYLVSRNGLRFLMNTLSEDVNTSPITLILNWKPPAK